MAYDENLAERMRALLRKEPGIVEKKMFGGLAFMVNGNMACGIVKDDLMLRLGAERFEEALAQPHARPMDFSGRPMVGMVYVGPRGCATDADLSRWLDVALGFVRTLPAKKPAAAKAKTPPRR